MTNIIPDTFDPHEERGTHIYREIGSRESARGGDTWRVCVNDCDIYIERERRRR